MEEVEARESAKPDGGGPPPQQPSLDNLPLELLIKIVSLLPWKQQLGTRRVSRRWLQAVDFHLKTLQRLHFDDPAELDDSKLEFLLRKMPELRSLTFRGEAEADKFRFTVQSRLSLNIVLKYCPHLEEAELHWFRYNPRLLRKFGSAHPGLKAVKLPRETDDSCLKTLLPHLTGLRSLDLSSTKVEGECFSLLPVSLDRLNFSLMCMLPGHLCDLAFCSNLRAIIAYLPWLLLDSPPSFLRTLLFSETAEWLRQLSCPQLRELHLSSPRYEAWHSNEDAAALLAACPRLERLSLHGCRFNGSTWLRELSQCSQLRELDMWGVSNIRPADLAQGLACCPMLELLTLDSLRGVDNGLLVLERCLPPPGDLPALRHLSVICLLISDGCLWRLSCLLPDLLTLNVTMTGLVSPTEEGWVACLPRFRQLQTLKLVDVTGVSDSLLDRLHDLPLRTLACVTGDLFTPEAVTRLLSACLSLKYTCLDDRCAVGGGGFLCNLLKHLSTDSTVTNSINLARINLSQPWFRRRVPYEHV